LHIQPRNQNAFTEALQVLHNELIQQGRIQGMRFIDTIFSDVKIIEPDVYGGVRGGLESWNQHNFHDMVLDTGQSMRFHQLQQMCVTGECV
jgi:hypothetical protein